MDSKISRYPEEGEIAPDFRFTAANGESKKLSDYWGDRCIVLYFYPKDFTPGCTIEAKEFSVDNDEFEGKGITILGISPDEMESHDKFKERMNIPYELISDPDYRIASMYGCYGPKNFMGKEYLGIHRSTFLIGKDGRIIKAFHRVKPSGHSKQVMREFANSC